MKIFSERMNRLLTDLISDRGVCRTATATPDLLNMRSQEGESHSHGGFELSAPPPFLNPFYTCLRLQAVTTFPREMLLPPSQICHTLSATHPLSINLDSRAHKQPVKIPI